MDPSSESLAQKSGSKVPVVRLERCDKIWKTLQVIKLMQDKHLRDIENWMKREPIGDENILCKEPPMTFIPDKSLPLNLIGEPDLPTKPITYIKYQPVLNNGDKSMPQFKLAEKRRVNLYNCETCGKQFCNYKHFYNHQDKLHGIILPKRIYPSKRERTSSKRSADRKNLTNSIDGDDKIIFNENFDPPNGVKTLTKSVKCKLCHRFYRDIEKHTARHHGATIIDESRKVSEQHSNCERVNSTTEMESNNNLPEIEQPIVDRGDRITTQSFELAAEDCTNNSLKRKAESPEIGCRNGVRSIKRKISDMKFQSGKLRCDICNRQFVYYNSLCKHRSKHKLLGRNIRSSGAKKNKLKSADSVKRNESGLESLALTKPAALDNGDGDIGLGQETPSIESSFTKEGNNFTDGLKAGGLTPTKNGKLKAKNKCLCGRSFRSSYILFTHKRNCKFIKKLDDERSRGSGIGGERDSGISIKIKKRNNSYEIVGKEMNEKNAFFEEILDSSSSVSDSSECDNRAENLVSEEAKYSKEHKVLKIKFVDEDIHVEIEDEAARNDDRDSRGQVPSLRDLCRALLVGKGLLPKRETTHKCRFCLIFLGSKEKLSKHMERHKKLMKRSCTCKKKFSSIERFDDHVMAMHPECLTCPYCKERYKSIVQWDEHVCLVDQGERYTEIYNENHPCPNCNVVFNNITWLDSHMKSEHLDPDLPFQCYRCVEKFPNEIARSIHFHKLHNQTSPCSVCHQKLQSTKTRQKHEAYHRGVGFPCHKCKKTYPSKRSKSYHVRTVHNERSNDKIQCFICKKIMKTRSFKKHVLRHNSKLDCKKCKKVFYDYRSLERHIMDYHRGEDYPREKCHICGYSFPTEEQLEAHIAVEHTVRNEHKND